MNEEQVHFLMLCGIAILSAFFALLPAIVGEISRWWEDRQSP